MISRRRDQKLREALITKRQMTSLIDKDLALVGNDLVFDRSDWISLYYDKGYGVISEDGMQTAYRAMTSDGVPLWFVFTKGKTRGYHADVEDPVEAIEMTRAALDRRRQVKQRWPEIVQLAKQLRRFQIRFEVSLDDADASPLCSMGIASFMRKIGMGWVHRGPGWIAAWMMLIEPQVGFVIYEAALRHGALKCWPMSRFEALAQH